MLVKIIGGHGGRAPNYRTTSYLVDGKLLIDAGSVAAGLLIDEQKLIENVLISHAHLDHLGDLPFLCDNCFGLKDEPFHVYSNKTVKKAIKQHIMNDIIWPDFTKIPSVENPIVSYHDLVPEKKVKIGQYDVLPVSVNHPTDALGFIISKGDTAIVFTQDTGPTERIWELAKLEPNLKAIFTEVSFPNAMEQVAKDSFQLTPMGLKNEMKKMPPKIPLFVGHLKPTHQTKLYEEIDKINEGRITLLGSDNATYMF